MKNNRKKTNKKYNVWRNRLSLIKFLTRIRLLETLEDITKRLNANKFVKKHHRDKVIAMLLIAIMLNSNSYKLAVEDQIYIGILMGQDKFQKAGTSYWVS